MVLVGAGVVLAFALTRGGTSHPVTGPGVGLLPTAPASAPATSTAFPIAKPKAAPGWPKGESAWTAVIASLPKKGHPRAAVDRIARAADLPGIRARVLDSSLHPRLRPSLWVVYVGRYGSRAQALHTVRLLQAAGTRGAVAERLTG